MSATLPGAIGASAGRLFACKPTHDNGSGASRTRVDFYGSFGAIHCAGSALHAEIPISYPRLFFVKSKYVMWADLSAASAADALVRIKI